MRFAIRFLLLFLALVLISPFFISSLLIDQRGVIVASHVVAKNEYISEHYSSWTRSMEISLAYDPPDAPGVAFLQAQISSEFRFDNLKKGDLVQLRYLREIDLPALPGAKTLWQMHVIPFVRLADQDTGSIFSDLFDARSPTVTAAVAACLLLFVWKLFRIQLFGWAVAVCVLSAITASVFSEFPRPTPQPKIDVRQARGVIKRLGRWQRIFQNNYERGLDADQPIQMVAIQFTPSGRLEPVVAVDLIDDGSIVGLYEKAPVTVEYEKATPRVAYITGPTRHFAQRNLKGVLTQGIACLVIIVIFWAGFHLTTRNRSA